MMRLVSVAVLLVFSSFGIAAAQMSNAEKQEECSSLHKKTDGHARLAEAMLDRAGRMIGNNPRPNDRAVTPSTLAALAQAHLKVADVLRNRALDVGCVRQ
ncbi:hypothetical protein [Azospirillum sp.]|uniref:hypothetical protein n=1 Tax=Azospirillum sp. TaxID=34012 RepID=UPI002D62B269|nr:hypothetical protein [Azospirillum sp.]HYD69556.1 hypothetical protein [Azospirillum sp.]